MLRGRLVSLAARGSRGFIARAVGVDAPVRVWAAAAARRSRWDGPIATAAKPRRTRSGSEAAVAGPRAPVAQVVAQLDVVERGMANMVPQNPGMVVRRDSPTSLSIVLADGRTYSARLDAEGDVFALSSPARLGSIQTYHWDPSQEAFVSVKDRHFFLEMLTRDLIYTSKGYPSF